MLRRCTAIILLFCLALFSGEALVADVHDGDATPAEIELANAPHGGSLPAADKTDAARQEAAPDGRQTNDGSTGQPVHSQHACHCVHAHGAVDTEGVRDGTGELLQQAAPAAHAMRMPPSRDRERQFRPPIA